MSPRDGCYWAGMMFGILVGVLSARSLGYPNIVGLIAGIVIGVGCGFACERIYTSLTGGADKDSKPPG